MTDAAVTRALALWQQAERDAEELPAGSQAHAEAALRAEELRLVHQRLLERSLRLGTGEVGERLVAEFWQLHGRVAGGRGCRVRATLGRARLERQRPAGK